MLDPFWTHVRFVRGSDWGGLGRRSPPPLAAAQTRLLTRLPPEVWFPGHACRALDTSLFTSLFAGKREAAPKAPRAAEGRGALVAEMRAGEAGPFLVSLPQWKIPAGRLPPLSFAWPWEPKTS